MLSSALSTPPAATLTNALAAGGRYFSLLTDSSIVIFAIRRYPDRLVLAATIPCPDGPEAHAWAQDGSLLVIASSRRIQVSHRCLTPIPSLCLTSRRFTMYSCLSTPFELTYAASRRVSVVALMAHLLHPDVACRIARR